LSLAAQSKAVADFIARAAGAKRANAAADAADTRSPKDSSGFELSLS